MRIVIDMQGAQTASRFRGIGRYTLSFVQAVVRNKGEHEIILALSGLFPETITPIRAAFENFLPAKNIRVWYAPGSVCEIYTENQQRLRVAELIREAFIASLKPDVVHVMSLIEGYEDDAVTHIEKLQQLVPVTVMLYDLIPLLNPDQYLTPNPIYAKYYERKLDSLKKASRYLAISEHARQEGIEQLNVDPNAVVNISTAIEPMFHPLTISEAQDTALRQKFGLLRPFVLYTGGTDERKNLPRLIKAYADLPLDLRQKHQLVFVGKMTESTIAEFKNIAKTSGLMPDELCLVGYITDEELIQLYNLSELFVFPSWHEGFGLPALEAMACGTPVIGANTSSLPEVIGLPSALFDPLNIESITAKMTEALTDINFNQQLSQHGVQQAKKFSWDKTAQLALHTWENLISSATSPASTDLSYLKKAKPKLAFVSPLPDERTGIADYSAELLPDLASYYDIYVIVTQTEVQSSWVREHCQVHDESWLRAHVHEIDRVIYQMGNSPFHAHMLQLIKDIPGILVLHDFYLSGLIGWLEQVAGVENAWTEALYLSHGYKAVQRRFEHAEEAKYQYPVNFSVLRAAQGVIVHSNYSCQLAEHWYGKAKLDNWTVIPLLRKPADFELTQSEARKELGIDPDSFVICSFGFLDSTKLNHRLLEAWSQSELRKDKRCILIFVGENHQGEYGLSLIKTIKKNKLTERVHITGFMSAEEFKKYLIAADMAVQLRTHSRGETSAAVLDCMNYGLPLIVNANGAIAEIDQTAVCMLADEFEDEDLILALETLWQSSEKRTLLAEKGQHIIHRYHAPAVCAKQYAKVIEHSHWRSRFSTDTLIQDLTTYLPSDSSDAELAYLSACIDATLVQVQPEKRLFLDVTATSTHDLKTGIERVARSFVLALLEMPPAGFRIEPVYLAEKEGVWVYCYARQYTLDLLGCPSQVLEDDIVDFQNEDLLLGLDLSGDRLIKADQSGLFNMLRHQGVKCYFMLYDLLPIRLPHVFPQGADDMHVRWAKVVATFDGVICISETVAKDFALWRLEMGIEQPETPSNFLIDWVHLGADVNSSAPSTGLPLNAVNILKQLTERPTFLMVGTIEPRKGHAQVIHAFTELWDRGIDINLVIVGKEGWEGLPNDMRRDIPETIKTLSHHPEAERRLFWMNGISDEYLEKIYASSTCLIAASTGEGFGLPLIEAAQSKIPIIARDIAVFREVAGEHAFYFSGTTASELAQSIENWLVLYKQEKHPKSAAMPWLTWKQSAQQLVSKIINN